MAAIYMLAAIVFTAADQPAPGAPQVFFQAHRGGVNEVPENTLTAYEHAWSIPGAVPEMDLCTTQDGVVVCMHDDTPKRTTDAPAPWADKEMKDIPFEEVKKWDAGKKFDAKYAGEHVPTLEEVLERMKGRPERQAYFDLKEIDLGLLTARIHACGIEKQVIFVHGDLAMCEKLQGLYEGARTMTWLSGKPEKIREAFAELAAQGFKGVNQLQFHLQAKKRSPRITYQLDPAFLREAAQRAKAAGVDLQLRPFVFDARSLRELIDLGVHWYVTDEPKAFSESVRAALALPAAK